MVVGRPDAERRDSHGRKLRRRSWHPGSEVGPVPVQRRGEGARPGQVAHVALLVAVAAAEPAQPGPGVVGKRRLRDALELEEELVPGHLVLPEGPRRARVADRQHDELLDPARLEHGDEPSGGRSPVVPHDVRGFDPERVEYSGHVADRVGKGVVGDRGRAARAPEPASGLRQPEHRAEGVVLLHSTWCYHEHVTSYPEITQRDLRSRSREIMDAVERGESFTVTRGGHRIGELTPLRRQRRFVTRDAFAAMSRNAPVIDPEAFRADQDAAAEHDAGNAYEQ